MTTLAVWADRGYEGVLLPYIVNDTDWHFRLGIFNGDPNEMVEIDATAQQFEPGSKFERIEPDNPMYKTMLEGSFKEDGSLKPRLQILIDRMRDEGHYDVGASADEIIDILQERYAERVFNKPDQKPKRKLGFNPT